MHRRAIVIALVSCLVLACGSEAALGESCDEEGVQDGQCESGLVCGKETDSSLRCQKVCSQQSDCPASQECNGLTGNVKACRVKK